MAAYTIDGHAIISDDDRISDATGRTPAALRNDADWAYFQAALDRAAAVVVGRLGHEANPNVKGRPRLIVSSRSGGIEHRPDGWWWDPGKTAFDAMLATAFPGGGTLAVTGGRRVNDLFLELGFDSFHLVRKHGVTVGEGALLFSRISEAGSAEALLARHGLHSGEPVDLDRAANVVLTIWSR